LQEKIKTTKKRTIILFVKLLEEINLLANIGID
jgi:hypothetical protein